jgi:biopolymer transport protein TolQ
MVLQPGPASSAQQTALDPLELMLRASGPGKVVLLVLIVASTSVWLIWILKSMQLRKLRNDQHRFEREADSAETVNDLINVALRHRTAPGARVVVELAKRQHYPNLSSELLLAMAKRAIAIEQQRATVLMPTLSSIASASPFVGLFGTVWGIMEAFLRIGVEKSASLPVVAPAIGEALIATALGLVAAIPATIGFNYIDKRIGDLLEELGAVSEAWAELFAAERAAVLAGAAAHPPAAAAGYMRGS